MNSLASDTRQACSPLIQLFFGFASDIDQTNINRDIRDSNWLSRLDSVRVKVELLDELGVRQIIHGKALKIYFGGKCSARRAESTYLAAASLAIGLATLAAKSLITRRYHEAHQ